MFDKIYHLSKMATLPFSGDWGRVTIMFALKASHGKNGEVIFFTSLKKKSKKTCKRA